MEQRAFSCALVRLILNKDCTERARSDLEMVPVPERSISRKVSRRFEEWEAIFRVKARVKEVDEEELDMARRGLGRLGRGGTRAYFRCWL